MQENLRPPFTYESLSAYSGLSAPTLRRLVAKGAIPHAKIGRRVLFPVAAIDAWLMDAAAASLRPVKQSPSDTVRRRRRVVQPVTARGGAA